MKRIIIALLCIMIPCYAFAHPGGTDSKGGHYDHSTGEYHYHHGYPAHQHDGGVCPYDFRDATQHHSGSNSGSSVSRAPMPDPKPEKDEDVVIPPVNYRGVAPFACGLGLIGASLLMCRERKK